jgi:peptidoglycan-N-acetylglucosamine deacetylase
MADFHITLTFDNGPEPDVTPGVLDTLARTGVAATFFVLGHKLALPGRRALAERAHGEGQWIGNHTWSHSVPLGDAPPEAAAREIEPTEALIGDLAHPDRLFRPFGGGGRLGRHLLSPATAALLTARGYTCVLWNAIPRDWADPDGWVGTALGQCRAQPWSLVVVHDLPTGAMAHLERFIEAARAAGGTFRQDFPPDCLPIRNGRAVRPLAPYVADAAA